MDVTWLVDEYLGNGKVRHAAFSSKRRAVEVAERSCDHSSKVILVEWTYCRPLSAQQLFPVRTDPVVSMASITRSTWEKSNTPSWGSQVLHVDSAIRTVLIPAFFIISISLSSLSYGMYSS